MTRPMNRAAQRAAVTLILSLSPFFWGGCSGTSWKNLSHARLNAIKHNQRGIEAGAKGNTNAALVEFSDALRLHSSIENTDGMVISLINIARMQRLKGDVPSARAAIDRASPLLPEPSDLASELFFEKAKIFLASGDLLGAKEWATRAVAVGKKSDLGRRVNLVGMILFRQGLTEQAQEHAERALALNRDDGMIEEVANSLRLLGEIHLARESNDKATGFFSEALSLDKELGLGKKIATDLRGLGTASEGKQDISASIGFYRRAMVVSLNSGDATSAADDLARLAELCRKGGEPLLAVKFDEERAKLLERKDKHRP